MENNKLKRETKNMVTEMVKFIIYSGLIVLISKYILVVTLRKLAEALNLNAKIVGDVAGYATSVPELLTITTSSLRGLTGASVYNILSSNVINLIQYIGAIMLNKNTSKLRNKAIVTDLILVFLTIVIPIFFLKFNIELKLAIVPIFIILYILFRFLNNHVHKLYLKNEDVILSLSTKEYEKMFDLPIIQLDFVIRNGHTFKRNAVYLKKARGMILNYLIEHHIEDIEQIKEIVIDDYHFSEDDSNDDHWVFIKNEKMKYIKK